jgi:hypothetical protein
MQTGIPGSSETAGRSRRRSARLRDLAASSLNVAQGLYRFYDSGRRYERGDKRCLAFALKGAK